MMMQPAFGLVHRAFCFLLKKKVIIIDMVSNPGRVATHPSPQVLPNAGPSGRTK
jgi:hypothetical protein